MNAPLSLGSISSTDAGHGDTKGSSFHRPTVTWGASQEATEISRVPHVRLEAQSGHSYDAAYRGRHPSTGTLAKVVHSQPSFMTPPRP